MCLYKFIEKEYLHSFFTSGCIRLGTIRDFRDVIEHGESRGDSGEGVHLKYRSTGLNMKITKDTREPIISEVIKMKGSGETTLSNFNIIIPRVSPDGFIFCASNTYNEKLFRKWNKNNSLDACYEIIKPRRFVNSITKAISSKAFFVGNEDVSYTEEYIDYDGKHGGTHPAFTKSKNQYSWQCENRTVWGCREPSGILKPLILHVPEAPKFCRRYAFMNGDKIAYP